MKNYELRYKQPARKAIQKLNPQIQQRLKAKLEYFIEQPDPLVFADALTKPADAQYRWRVGNYRILLDVESNYIVILVVRHRKDVYRKKTNSNKD